MRILILILMVNTGLVFLLRILLYTLLELLFSEFVPEIQETLHLYRRIIKQT